MKYLYAWKVILWTLDDPYINLKVRLLNKVLRSAFFVKILPHKKRLNDEVISWFPKLISLDTSWNHFITDLSVKNLTSLKYLSAGYKSSITDESVKNLTKLRTLIVVGSDSSITDKSVKLLTNLTSLEVKWKESISDKSIKLLTNLTSLDVSGCTLITDE
jgi:hypothetical protein